MAEPPTRPSSTSSSTTTTSSTTTWIPPTTTTTTTTTPPTTTTTWTTPTTTRPTTTDTPTTRPPTTTTTTPAVIPPTTVPNRTTTSAGVLTSNSGSVTSITLGATPNGVKTTDDGGLPEAAVIGIGVTAALIVGFVIMVMVYKTRHRRHKALGQDDLFDHLPIESPKPPPPPMGNIHHLAGHGVGHQEHNNHNHNDHHHETDNLYNNSEYHHHQGHHGDHQGYDHHYDGDQGTSQHHPGDLNQAPNQGGHGASGNQGFSGGDGGQGISGNQGFSGNGQGFGNQGFGGNQGGLDQLGSTHTHTGFEGHHGFDGHHGFGHGGGHSSGQGQGFSNGPSGAQPQGFTPTNQPFGPGPSQSTGNIGGAGIGSTGVNLGHIVSTTPLPPAGPVLDYKKPPPLAPRPDSTITSPTLTSPSSGLDHRASISSVASSGILQPWDGDSAHTYANNTGYSPQSKQNLLTQVQGANYSQDLNYVRPPPHASPRVLVSPTIATIPPANVRPMVRAPQDRTSSEAVGAITSTGNVSSLNTFDRRHPQLQGDGHHESLF
ncbi:hypothetical protein BG000_009248 [Podila horticola]|nr:hypothetical protein BG000_009248 [Podila horticola]